MLLGCESVFKKDLLCFSTDSCFLLSHCKTEVCLSLCTGSHQESNSLYRYTRSMYMTSHKSSSPCGTELEK